MGEEEKIQPGETPSLPPVEGRAAAGPPAGAEILTAKIAELEQAVAQYKDQLLRKAAEFDNYKKRSESESLTLIKYANEDLIVKLLPVLDDFERSLKVRLAANGESGEQSGFLRGVELIYNKFKKLLESCGVKEFEVLGKPFDPNLHDALLQIPKPGVPAHTIIEEVEKGYMMHDRVIRHARVIVSADSVEETPAGNAPEPGEE